MYEDIIIQDAETGVYLLNKGDHRILVVTDKDNGALELAKMSGGDKATFLYSVNLLVFKMFYEYLRDFKGTAEIDREVLDDLIDTSWRRYIRESSE